jgi:hypothetical protein
MSLLKNGEVKPEKFKNMSAVTVKSSNSIGETQNWVEVVRQQVGSLRFGVVQIVIHDSQVTQIDKTERVRLDKSRVQTI